MNGLGADKAPVTVDPGSLVCVARTTVYLANGGRWVFQKWGHGPTTDCVTLSSPGSYKAFYTHEVLLQVRSSVGDIQRSTWIVAGEPVTLQAPDTVAKGERARYKFQLWDRGQTPFLPTNTIAVLAPAQVEAKWTAEHLLQVDGPAGAAVQGSGWYQEGSSAVLQAPDIVESQASGERMKFARWESVGSRPLTISGGDKPLMTVKVEAAYNIRAV